MQKKDKKETVKNFDADMGAREQGSVASATEATGLMYAPPRTRTELENDEELFPLMSESPEEAYMRDRHTESAFSFPRGGR